MLVQDPIEDIGKLGSLFSCPALEFLFPTLEVDGVEVGQLVCVE